MAPSAAASVGSASPASPATDGTPRSEPASGSASGRIVRFVPEGFVIAAGGHEVVVDTHLVVSVWKETQVPPDALAVGDDVFANGTPGTPFLARTVWADIGVLHGYIREIDGAGMDLEVHAVQGAVFRERIDFSAYLERASGTARADLAVGRAIGAVIYRPAAGPPRATRIWLE